MRVDLQSILCRYLVDDYSKGFENSQNPADLKNFYELGPLLLTFNRLSGFKTTLLDLVMFRKKMGIFKAI